MSEKPLTAFVSFPSIYTQSLIIQALISTLPNLSLSLVPLTEDSPSQLQWADYDVLSFTLPHALPTRYLTSSYVYRKALIRKHQLQLTIIEYLAKVKHRGIKTVLEHAVPLSWVVELQFADELDELLRDELWDLRENLDQAKSLARSDRHKWYILKPGFADRGQGIRLFATEDELRAIFEIFEPPDSEDEEFDIKDQGTKSQDVKELANDTLDPLTASTAELRMDDVDEDVDDADDGTGVVTSELRHFVIQEYQSRPILFDVAEHSNDPSACLTGYKVSFVIGFVVEISQFHLRAYVLITGGYTVHLARTLLALFSASPYIPPWCTPSDDEIDLLPHLTNTCLQTDAYGAPTRPEELVKPFCDLEGLTAIGSKVDGAYESYGKVDRAWLNKTFTQVGEIVAESVKAGAECGSFGLQLVPNAFEIFGADLLLGYPSDSKVDPNGRLPIPEVTLLEYNASPDFHQSGDRLRPELLEMFKGVVRISVAPFFGVVTTPEKDAQESDIVKRAEQQAWEVGQERWGWTLFGRGEVRGPSAK